MSDPLSNPSSTYPKPVERLTSDEASRAPGDKVWDQFAELFDLLDEMAKSQLSPQEFYQRLLAETVSGFAALAGRAWVPKAEGGFQLLSQVGPMPLAEYQGAHEKLLGESTDSINAETVTIGPQAVTVVQVTSKQIASHTSQPHALIELTQRTDCPEELYRSTERLLEAIANVASDFHQQQQTMSLKGDYQFQQSLLGLAQQVAGDLRLGPTSYRIVNNCRQELHADRVSVVRLDGLRGHRARILAVSGVDHVDERSASTRSICQIAKMVANDRRPMTWSVGALANPTNSFPEECLGQLDIYADKSHVKTLVAVPMFAPNAIDNGSNEEERDYQSKQSKLDPIQAVLIVESFQSGSSQLASNQIQMMAQVCAPALDAAMKTPFASLQRLLARWLVPKRLLALLTLAAIGISLGYLATVVEIEHTVTLRGTVEPLRQSELYAPADARVARTYVVGGQQVEKGEPLLELRDARSLLELQQIQGELLSAEQQYDSISATRMSLDRSSVAPTEMLRLAAEQERLALRVQSLKNEIQLVEAERKRLLVVSPLTGMVTTWQPDDLLVNRPVKRGQRLLTVVDNTTGWKIELHLPDDRLGILQEAEKVNDEPLQVCFELASEPSVVRWGKIANYAPIAEDVDESSYANQRTVRLEVIPEISLVMDGSGNKTGTTTPLAGVSVRAEVQCGKRSLAYVALHDIWHFLSTRWQLGW